MRRAERIVIAFGALGEAGQPAALTERTDTIAAAGDDLVRISLMPDVPDEPVVRCVEHVMQGDRQFDDAEARTEMAAGHGDRVDHVLTEFGGKLGQVGFRQGAQIGWNSDPVEEGRFRGLGHRISLNS